MMWTSIWLEFHDWWLLFVWGHYVLFGEIGILGSINEPGLISINLVFLSILWIILGIALLISYYIDTKKHHLSLVGGAVVIVILILQILLPIIFIQLSISPGVLISNIIPIPAPSIIMAGIYITYFIHQRDTTVGIE
jgi:hypothetical protein